MHDLSRLTVSNSRKDVVEREDYLTSIALRSITIQ